jgi:putative hydrolase of the HAD superfamily
VGDNRLLDAEGSTAAGLAGVWLNRAGEVVEGFDGTAVSTLADLLPLFV